MNRLSGKLIDNSCGDAYGSVTVGVLNRNMMRLVSCYFPSLCSNQGRPSTQICCPDVYKFIRLSPLELYNFVPCLAKAQKQAENTPSGTLLKVVACKRYAQS